MAHSRRLPRIAQQLAKKKEKERRRKKKEDKLNRKNLANVRVIQKNLVYITNLAINFAKEEVSLCSCVCVVVVGGGLPGPRAERERGLFFLVPPSPLQTCAAPPQARVLWAVRQNPEGCRQHKQPLQHQLPRRS